MAYVTQLPACLILWLPTTLHAILLQDVEAQEARLLCRTDELSAADRRIAAAQQGLDSESERLKRAAAAAEEKAAAVKVR